MRRGTRAAPALPAPVEVMIESLTHEGRGVARVEGKALFVDGALPGERVRARYVARHRRYDQAAVDEVLQASPDRADPRCPHFGVCGGCSLQHMHPEAQIRAREQAVLEVLEHVGRVRPQRTLEPIVADPWGYRRKARLSAKYVLKKGGALVGFRERYSHFLAALEGCEVLHPAVGRRIRALRDLLTTMDARDRIPQIEIAVDDDDQTALVFRNLKPLSPADRERLESFAREQGVQVWLQPKGPDTVHPLWPAEPVPLIYAHPDFDVHIPFGPLDFVQVNRDINRAMVAQAVELLGAGPRDRVLDLFCGLGNFALPLARRAGHVTGVEGETAMVARARDNAALNGIANTTFHAADLAVKDVADAAWAREAYDAVLLDPPRAGAAGVMDLLGRLRAQRIVYVSCNPATLARDADVLVNTHGYDLEAAGVMDMFPHTAHVESMALFVRR
ncbi:23S rRNA (uracil(1939)-C(5))-methyltransferase [Thioalkalivibrio denitrificans]|uniref:23S rRNA (uracil(1939)-C(5))-methyltransferase RlmD n=1 Tax=Thioalkalivibrio denitrificans TaxID=108003 RepID=A0A1V3NQC4_9GAMM|nr:23S rRNA (uracil(1939)-C(5))-methyltransferase RlmD [Thioalkalivibrio denitrificans]OOG27204.1 23S rRNA (uracil(1939)-C(5))-methyltransferase [Thioalkalivibrio denitrificans]